MAWTVTRNYMTVFGDQKVCIYDVTTDGAETELSMGDFSAIYHLQVGAQSLTSNTWSIRHAYDSSGVASAPNAVGCSGFTTGDLFTLIVYGRG